MRELEERILKGGGDKLRAQGYRVESLARIARMNVSEGGAPQIEFMG